jgi:uncharacterized ion transporter superfamily protein YfcC
MSEQEMNFREKSQTDPSASFHHVEDEKHYTNYSFEKLNPQTRQHKPSFGKRLALALSSIGLLILIFFLLATSTNLLIFFHRQYNIQILLASYFFFFLLIIAAITINILYNLKR